MSKDEIETLAVNLIHQHLPNQGWQFKWSRAVKTLGYCCYRTKTICLSYKWIEPLPDEEVIDTILHEIAHAMTPEDKGHGLQWQMACLQIGAKPEAEYDGPVDFDHIELPKYEMIDTTTGNVVYKYYRKPATKTYAKLKYMYMPGRKKETLGKLIIREVSLLDFL